MRHLRALRFALPTAAASCLLLGLAACQRFPGGSAPQSTVAAGNEQPPIAAMSSPTAALTATPSTNVGLSAPAAAVTASSPALAPAAGSLESAATPVNPGESTAACGQMLPILANGPPLVAPLEPDAAALAELNALIPDAASPALQRLLGASETVGLAAYRAGREQEGAYLNADVQMPLASVVKIINLVAYVEAVAAGQLDPGSLVTITELERYYLPGLDLGAHRASVNELETLARILPDPPAVRLEDIPWMMIRHSSNAASDYLHFRLGQSTIEETAVALGLSSQTAPCPFIGQFLAMNNHTRTGSPDSNAIMRYIEEPFRYGLEVMELTQAFANDPIFRQLERGDRRRPSISTQRLFSENLNPQASARDYAALMAQIAQNGLSNAESSFMARLYLEWPMRFTVNQELFSNLGYKNGAMPGVLTTVYYAYPIGDTTPVVVALFYRDLPNGLYQRWRRSELAHDEFARWLLYDPAAIPALKAALEST